MIGIVLWSDPEDRKAVFWCEDQGDLAYFEDSELSVDGQGAFFAGDMVQFDVSAAHRMRKAHHPKLLQEQAYAELPDALRRNSMPANPRNAGQSARIIPFAPLDDEKVLAGQSARNA